MVGTACTTDSSEEEAVEAGEEAAAETEEAADEGGDAVVVGGCEAGNINISGSSTVEPISRRAAELYEAQCAEAIITVDGPGPGDGFKLFCDGETDVSDASRQIKDEEAATCAENGIEFTELKVAFDGIAVMTNPANEAVACLSFVDLYALLGGQSEGFANWSDASDLAAFSGPTSPPTRTPRRTSWLPVPSREPTTASSRLCSRASPRSRVTSS